MSQTGMPPDLLHTPHLTIAPIAEASSRGVMHRVLLKSHEQLALQAAHRVRQRFIIERISTVNQMRALLLEYGLTVPVGR